MGWSKYRRPMRPAYLAGPQMRQAAEQGTEFLIQAIEPDPAHTSVTSTGKTIEVRDSWLLTVASVETGELATIRLTQAPNRDEEMRDAAADLAAGEGPIGPVRLVRVETRSGRPFYRIEDSDQSTK